MFTKDQLLRAADSRRARLDAMGASDGAAHLRTPGDVVRSQTFGARIRSQEVEKDGKRFVRLTGTGSTYDKPYMVWDSDGPYHETVARGAGADTLAGSPDVVFLINHRGLSLARTTNGTLSLTETDEGLEFEALVNPLRSDVSDLVMAVEDRTVTECSFAFRITSGDWSPDYSSYTIKGYDLDRGDVSACTYGANPATSIEARSDVLRVLGGMRDEDLLTVHGALTERLAGASAPTGGVTGYPVLRSDLEALAGRMRERALTTEDQASLALLLGRMAAAGASLAPFVDALKGADCALKGASMALSDLLGLPTAVEEEPGVEEPGGETLSGPSLDLVRHLLDADMI